MSIVAMATAANTILSPSLTSSSSSWYGGILGCSQSSGYGRLEFGCKQGMFPIPSLKSPARLLLRCRAVRASGAKEESGFGFRGKPAKDVSVMVTGSTGYIGRFVVHELARRGYNVVAIAREKSGKQQAETTKLSGSEVCFADVTDPSSLQSALRGRSIDVVVCCLASRNGGVKDSWKIDYEATKNSLEAGIAAGASHFVLLSAICVQKPLLEFQRAKLRFESQLQQQGRVTWSIVRPTAFFKSLGGQVEIVKGGGPFVVFGDGKLCSCKPISEPDLARFISDCVSDTEKMNRVLPIGGPGKAYTPLEQGELLFRIVGRKPSFVKVPIQIMDAAIGVLGYLAKIFPALEDPAEYAKIGRYYAAESMLVMDPATGKYDEDATPSYGEETLEQFFERVVKEGMAGQELGEQAPAAFLQHNDDARVRKTHIFK